MSEDVASPVAVSLPAVLSEAGEIIPTRRGRGRPLGSGNKSLVTEKRVRQHNAARSFLDRIVRGIRIKAALKTGGTEREWCFPTPAERIKAAEIQLRDAGHVQAVLAAEGGLQMGPAAIINIQINQITP